MQKSTSLNVGLVGQAFMGRAHANAYRQAQAFFGAPRVPELKVVCGRDASALTAFAQRFGFQKTTTDWHAVTQDPDVDLVDICASNDLHSSLAIEAAQAGKAVFCEKPLARNLSEARAMVRAVETAGVPHMVCFNYRFLPAVRLAKRLIVEGAVGRLRHFRALYLQDWLSDPRTPLAWRMRGDEAGSGALGDTGVHIVDLARYLVGEVHEVAGYLSTFVKQRPLPHGNGTGAVTVDDATAFLAELEGGVSGVFESTRMATGRKNFMHLEINGERGSIQWNAEELNSLWLYREDDPAHARGFRRIVVTEPEHGWPAHWWPPGHTLGYEHSFVHAVVELLAAIDQGRPAEPSFHDGLRAQAVLEAVQDSVRRRQWVSVCCD